jgi:hypothetical protein
MRLARPVLRVGLSRKLKQDFERMAGLMAEETVSQDVYPAQSSKVADLSEV